ncbi:corrinoid protein [Hominifimenecus sp. rT4P-3]|uniref:corrinoid protein n=1 Tax=Hominifimenecus sp. rT4P-3 TaxID=3242979 RepID=UPI003DA30BD4
MSKLQEISAAVSAGKKKQVPGLVQEALDEGIAPEVILQEGMIQAMNEVGEKFRLNEIFVPEMLVAARAMKAGVEVLKPHLAGENNVMRGKMVMGTVHGDLHDIGKNLVILMIESAGFEVIDLGVDVPTADFVAAASAPDVDIVGLSALLTTTLPALQESVAALNEMECRGRFKVMVGGAPVTQKFADEIGADIYTEDAASAAKAATEAVG